MYVAGRMASELELLQSAFESYKGTLHSETTQKQNRVEGEHRLKSEEEKQQAIHEISENFVSAFIPTFYFLYF